jgi:hypothetical protein
MAQASQPDGKEQVRAAVSARYSSLAQAARAGETITDCDPGTFAAGGFGPGRIRRHRRPTRRRGAGQPGLRQPGRGGRHCHAIEISRTSAYSAAGRWDAA